MTEGQDRPGRIGGFDAGEAARLALQVQDLGFDAARSVVERFVEMFDRFRPVDLDPGTTGVPAGGTARLLADDGAYRRLRAEAERALDSYLAVLRRLNEVGAGFLESVRSLDDPVPEASVLVLPDVAPGGRSSARMWLHNGSASAVTGARPWTPGLTRHSGDSLDPSTVSFSPARIERLDPGGSQEILVVVTVPAGAGCGPYHGQVLVEQLADVAFPIRVGVVAAPGEP